MKIIDNFLPEKFQDEIEQTLLTDFPWYYNHEATYDEFQDHRTLNTPFFAHVFYCDNSINSGYYQRVCVPIMEFLERYTGKKYQNRIWRIKANLYTKDGSYPEDFHHPPHIDNTNKDFKDGETFLYFVNDADADTFMFNEFYDFERQKYGDENFNGHFTNYMRVPPKKGKGILFDIAQSHTSSIPRKGGARITLNFVFSP